MNNNEITQIIFLPVCKKCMNIIKTTVNCEQRTGIVCGRPQIIGSQYDIEPSQCPNCKALIDAIEIPTKLPFNTFDAIRTL